MFSGRCGVREKALRRSRAKALALRHLDTLCQPPVPFEPFQAAFGSALSFLTPLCFAGS
jgi:hypothetical protein